MGEESEAKKLWEKCQELALLEKASLQPYLKIIFFAPMTFEGTCETNLFNAWLREVLIPELRPGQVLILDNASFHKSLETKRLIEESGCHLLFLPPYSPDLNPIEKCWANLKK